MPKCCFVTGKKVLFGNNVSNSNRRTRKRFESNLHYHKFWIQNESRFVKVLLSTKGLRIINKVGIEKVLLKIKNGFKF